MAHLDELDAEAVGSDKLYTGKVRIDVIPSAIEDLSRYPRRPIADEMAEYPQELLNLRTILQDAPQREDGDLLAVAQHVEGGPVKDSFGYTHLTEDGFPVCNTIYDQNEQSLGKRDGRSAEFTNSVEEELDQIKLKHGLESEVSLLGHWLVYDAVSSSFCITVMHWLTGVSVHSHWRHSIRRRDRNLDR